jgi:hypothetical protein
VAVVAVAVERLACRGEDESCHDCWRSVACPAFVGHVQVCQGDQASLPCHAAADSVVERTDLFVLSSVLPWGLTCWVAEAGAGLLIEFLVGAVCPAVQVVVAASLVHPAACSDCQEVTLIPCLAIHQVQETLALTGHPCYHPQTPCQVLTAQEQVVAGQAVVSWSWEACWSTEGQVQPPACRSQAESQLQRWVVCSCHQRRGQGSLASCEESQGSWDAFLLGLGQDSSVECSAG